MMYPPEGENYISYVYQITKYELLLEVQFDTSETDHVWHIFLHMNAPDGGTVLKIKDDDTRLSLRIPFTVYFRISGGSLYDAIMEAVEKFDRIYGSLFFIKCLLVGDWSKDGHGMPSLNKRVWYYRLFNSDVVEDMVKGLTQAQHKYFVQFL